jgi:hypothetical protein
MKKNLRVYYDEEGDFLEISVGTPSAGYADEIQPGIFVRKDEKTDEVKSIGIIGFKGQAKRLKDMTFILPVSAEITA